MTLQGLGGDVTVGDGFYSAAEDHDLTQRCADSIRDYWIRRGYATITAKAVSDNGRMIVMSNLVNGLPPGARIADVIVGRGLI